jgi:hypothetical protein
MHYKLNLIYIDQDNNETREFERIFYTEIAARSYINDRVLFWSRLPRYNAPQKSYSSWELIPQCDEPIDTEPVEPTPEPAKPVVTYFNGKTQVFGIIDWTTSDGMAFVETLGEPDNGLWLSLESLTEAPMHGCEPPPIKDCNGVEIEPGMIVKGENIWNTDVNLYCVVAVEHGIIPRCYTTSPDTHHKSFYFEYPECWLEVQDVGCEEPPSWQNQSLFKRKCTDRTGVEIEKGYLVKSSIFSNRVYVVVNAWGFDNMVYGWFVDENGKRWYKSFPSVFSQILTMTCEMPDEYLAAIATQ